MTRKYESFYWLNETSRTFLSRGYLSEGETAESRLMDIAKRAEDLLKKPGFAEKFYENMSKGWYSLATPVWTNFGKKRGMPVSCFNGHVSDDVGGILYAQGEVGMMSKIGGGTSGYFGELRPRGAEIADNGKSTGVVHFLELFQSTTNVISQGNSRRGRMSPYLPISHGDIDEFLDIGSDGHVIQDMNHGVIVDDWWIKEMVAGDSEKRKVWAKLLKRRKEIGYPYLMFRDNANKQAPEVYKDNGRVINSSNLCVAPETKILTKDGYKVISEVAGTKQSVWNGEEWSDVDVVKTGENQKLIRVTVRSVVDSEPMSELECTEYHKWYLSDGSEVKTSDLMVGDKLLQWTDVDGSIVQDEVIAINDDGRIDDTYCFTEPKRHMGVFNGVLTGNCNEIYLSSTEDESFTCVLSSMNLLHYDEWKDTDAVETLTYFLDAVAEEFIQKLEEFRDSPNRDDNLVWEYMKRAHEFTQNQRALGLGVLGWHSLLQSKMIGIESREAAKLNLEVFKALSQKTLQASKDMAVEYGEPRLLKGYGRRNTTLMAIAPTTSSAAILGQVSQSIEPQMSNYYVKDMAKVKTVIKNKYLEELLDSKGLNTKDVWDSIADNDGSVQHLDFLSEEEKEVYLTFGEIDPNVIIDQAAIRQQYIDQGQSLNLMIPNSWTVKEINALHLKAWEMGLKGLYYMHGTNSAQTLLRAKNAECKACDG